MVPQASILSIPEELKRLIVELSSGSPSSLAALALTHTSYQSEAEKALYNTLCIFTSCDNSLKCMRTLTTNPEKAALVRFLTIEYARDNSNINSDNNRRVTTYLSKSLINMRTLSDLRIRSRPCDEAKMKKRGEKLTKILCEGHFRLQTLYCHHDRNISQIIKSQTELKILGLYEPGGVRNILKTLKELHNAQLFLPIVLTLERVSFTPYPDHIEIFPAFYTVDRCATMHQVLAQSFCKDQGEYMAANVGNVCKLSFYVIDSSDMPSITALAKNMAVSFPQIYTLNLCFERRCEIPSREIIKEEFSFFSDLTRVNTFNYWF